MSAENFNGEIFKSLLKHDFGKIRLLAAKNIAKLSDTENLDLLYQAFQNEQDTTVKREIVSAIGRTRNIKNKQILLNILQDNDPKIYASPQS